MQWWCSARGIPWSWTWQPYPGVWALVAVLAVGYAWWVAPAAARHQRVWWAAGLVSLWAGLDWPLGPLGAGYLASVHVVQFLLIGVTAPAFLLLGFPQRLARRWLERPRLAALLGDLSHPAVAFSVFTVVMTVTHWPDVSDALMASQAGAFAIDVGWLAAGLWFWWPVIVEVPERPRFGPMLKTAYLAVNGLLVHPPAAVMLFSEHPVYATYELAPPIPGVNVLDDQQLAGGIMKVGLAWLMAVGIAVVIWRWHRGRAVPQEARGAATSL